MHNWLEAHTGLIFQLDGVVSYLPPQNNAINRKLSLSENRNQ